MKRSDFTYELPEALIAQAPPPRRRDARLLALTKGSRQDLGIVDLPALLRDGDLLVFNDTRVIPARLRALRDSGGVVEIMIERIVDAHTAWAFLRASNALPPGLLLRVGNSVVTVGEREEALFRLELAGQQWSDLLDEHGEMPLPPYIRRAADAADRQRYQTVYARAPGAVAAPTAGLHFDEEMLAALAERGIEQAFVTLHVGAGTFSPVRADDLSQHRMHAERIEVSQTVVEAVQRTRAAGGRIVAVGTTVVRALETAAADGALAPFHGESRLFIMPGYRFRVVDALLTNFHLPESTLLMLVCAFAGQDGVLAAYRHAVAQQYRFFSYGDAMWLERCDEI